MLTCAQNVMLPMDFAGLYRPGTEQLARALELLGEVDIAEHAHKLPSAVSGGQRQRVAIARALANDPVFLAADEPTGSLDSKTADAVFHVFERLVARGKTVFIATHDRELASRASRVLRIEDGEIVEDVSRATEGLDMFRWRRNGDSAGIVPAAGGYNGGGIAAPGAAMIDLRGVVKVYETAAGPFVALRGVDLAVQAGEFVAVVGKSGSGKSTLINMFTGIDHPTEGEVIVANTAIRHLNEGKMAEWRGRTMGIIFQFFQLLPVLSVIENVMIPMDLAGLYGLRERYDRAMHLLEQVGIAGDANKFPAVLSAGEQQRAAIARALANDPPILVADEPTGNLDTKAAATVFELFEALVAQGKTILMVTHDDELAHRVPRTVTIADGLIVGDVVRSSGVPHIANSVE